MNVTLDDIARSYFQYTEKNTLHGYVKAMRILIDFLRQFASNHTYMDHVTVLKVDEKYCIQLPEDFMSLNTLAYISGDRLIKFDRDRTINLFQNYADDYASATKNDSYDISIFQSNSSSAYYMLECFDPTVNTGLTLLGKGHNRVGYWNYSWESKEIQFSSDSKVSNGVYLSYKSNGFNPKTKSSIPEIFADVARDYLHWQMARFDRRLGDAAAETEARRRTYLRTYDDVMAAIDPIDYESFVAPMARAFDVNKLVS